MPDTTPFAVGTPVLTLPGGDQGIEEPLVG
jgi:hypothetical protein